MLDFSVIINITNVENTLLGRMFRQQVRLSAGPIGSASVKFRQTFPANGLSKRFGGDQEGDNGCR